MFEKKNEQNSNIQGERLQVVVFKLSGEEFGVDIMHVSEIISVPKTITRVPQAPDFVKGLINLRGKIIVVINLNTRLGFAPQEEDEHSRIVVVEAGESQVGMLVNSVTRVKWLPLSCIEPTPEMIKSKINAEYLVGVGKVEEELLILLNLAKVLGEEEVDELSQLQLDRGLDI
ncbi:MAG: chemotaxis protein CheW [Methanosarcinaceae archaeon]|nr:chemotaxis protein CheW [Methanosarcinaceae archaeon]MDD4496559.1 chemotaxis protein CheW [Methanosarcinaceae archaeon]